jgi:hypothetical protein
MKFINKKYKGTLCVTYFDEAHELALRFWVLLRLLANQSSSQKMWYIFMGTKSSMNYFVPHRKDGQSPCFSVVHIANQRNSMFSPT